MGMEPISDNEIMAYADGCLDRADMARIDAAIAADPALQARLRAFAATRDVLDDLARQPPPPVPAALEARIRAITAAADPARPAQADTLLRFPAPRTPPSGVAGAVPLAIAASLALAVGLGAGLLAGGGGGRDASAGLPMAALTDPDLNRALSGLPSGSDTGIGQDRVAMVSTFLNAADEVCREFEYAPRDRPPVVSVACHDGTGWDMRFAVASGSAQAPGYIPASSLDALDAFLAEAAPPLSPLDEAAVLTALD